MAPEPSEAAREVYRATLLDSDLRDLRQEYCTGAVVAIETVANWLTFDALLAGGDRSGAEDSLAPPDPLRVRAFRGAAAVVEMAGELARGALIMLDADHRYAAAALIRQLIETEYLLTAFAADFTRAAEWIEATPADIRRSFSPASMRKIGGFSNVEYWQHCDIGGHPAPSGRVMLRSAATGDETDDAVVAASVRGDLAQHLRRLWRSLDTLLAGEHARYARVRASERESVAFLDARWAARDPLARPVDFELLDRLIAKQSDE